MPILTSSSEPAAARDPASLDLVLRLRHRRREALDVESFELIDPAGRPLPPFEAGSHLLVECTRGIVRSYSLCNSPAERHRYQIAVLREAASRGGSAAVHADWQVGCTVRTSSPRNHFPLAAASTAPDGGRVLLLAGGIGITPLLAMAEELQRRARPFELHYCTRSAERAAFIDRLRAAPYAGAVLLHHDDGPPAQRFDAAAALGPAGPHDHLYVCGPAGFIDHVHAAATALGWPDAQRHHELFGALTELHVAGDQPFEIVVANRGLSVMVGAGETALAALRRAGIDVLSSCDEGVCGTCLTGVVEGMPDHRDQYLTEADRARNDCFTPCCSRARGGRLVIEV